MDPFAVFRNVLFVALAIYTVLALASTLRQAIHLLAGDAAHQRLLRAYLGYQLVSFRLRPVAGELVQIGLLGLLLAGLWYLHTVL